MSRSLPPEIKKGLASLKKRIRRIQLFRGLLRVASVVFGGLLLIVALDFFFAPLSSAIRAGLFFLWIAAAVIATVYFLVRPLTKKLTMVRLARWFEDRHPEVQERISTTLELSDQSDGISPALLAQLSDEAASDLSTVNPRAEVGTGRLRKALWPALSVLLAIIALFAVWPREMGRLVSRAVLPFSSLGNAGAFRFEIQPGDAEVLEGDPLALEFSYRGDLDKPLELFMERDGKIVSETLKPNESNDGVHQFTYQIHSADEGFRYFAQVGSSESDQFEVTVHQLPRLIDAVVTLQYPAYTGWPDQKTKPGGGIEALAGTEIKLTGRFETPVESGEFLLDSEKLNPVEFSQSARGPAMTWTQTLSPGTDGTAVLTVRHKLGRDLPGARYNLKSLEDPVPVVELRAPLQREFRVRPDDQIDLVYRVDEEIGLSKAEIQLEVGGQLVDPIPELLPEKINPESSVWEGKAIVYLGSLLKDFKGTNRFRLRLAISDNRPADLLGPGVGYSDWLDITLDQNAPSLVRQELQAQEQEFHKTIEKSVQEIHQSRSQIHQARGDLQKEEVSERSQEALAEARDKLQEAIEKLDELGEKMEGSIQEHRQAALEPTLEKMERAQASIENTPLQDTPEARLSETENALRETEEAIKELQQMRREAQQDQPRLEDLAKLQELAQKQERLAREAASETKSETDQEWQKKQEQVKNEIRNRVNQTPEAKAASKKSESEQARELAEQAENLKASQEELAKLTDQAAKAGELPEAERLAEAFAEAQKDVVEKAREIAQAEIPKEGKEKMANALPKAEEALDQLKNQSLEEAAETARQAAEQMASAPPESQDPESPKSNTPEKNQVAEKQEAVAEGLEALAKGNEDLARKALEKLMNKELAEALTEALAKEQADVVDGTRKELEQARTDQEERANDLPEALAQAANAEKMAELFDPAKAAEAAEKAASELSKGADEAPAQQDLQGRQEKIAEALKAVAEGKNAEAMAALDELQTDQARKLAEGIEEIVPTQGDHFSEARSQSQQASKQATSAQDAKQSGESEKAARSHQQAAKHLERTQNALERSADHLADQAEKAAGQQPNDRAAPTPGQPLADALQESAKASQAESQGEAASESQAAADSLKKAASEARNAMAQGRKPGQGEGQPGQEGKPNPNGQNKPGQGDPGRNGKPGDEAKDQFRQAQADQGVPPELAKLGINRSDWEKIQATLKSEVGGSSGNVVPEDYRGLVQQYFEQVSKEK